MKGAVVRRMMFARAAQTTWLVALMTVSVAPLAAAPWYEESAVAATTAASVSAASPDERVLTITRQVDLTREPGSPVVLARADVAAVLLRSGIEANGEVVGLSTSATTTIDSAAVTLVVASREGACDHMTVRGLCPADDRD